MKINKAFDLFKRPPDVKIQRENRPYLNRWYIIPRNRFFNIYLHHFIKSDYDKFLHDHPWWNLSILLTGDYLEWLPKCFENKYFFDYNLKTIHRKKGSIVLRSGKCAHKIELFKDLKGKDKPVWTLFLTGPKYREWGFFTKSAWIHWEGFLSNIEKYEEE